MAKGVPQDVKEAIYSYYGIREAVRTMRKMIKGMPSQLKKKTVLFTGVRWVESEGEKGSQGRMGEDELPVLRQRVRGNSSICKEREAKILFEGVSCEGEYCGESKREGSHGEDAGSDVTEGQGKTGDGAVVSVEGRQIYERSRLSLCNGNFAYGTPASACEADDAEEIYPRAQDCGGRHRGEAVGSGRDGASQKWQQGRQSTGEFAGCASEATYDQAPRGREEDVYSGGGEQEAAQGTGRIEVKYEAIPVGWLKYFEVSSLDPGCKLRGTKKVKGGAVYVC